MEKVNIDIENSEKGQSHRMSLILNVLKENIPFAVAITTILGGINQFYNLLKIGAYYVRFFSLTQLISDGLWIIYLLLPLYIVTFFLIPFIFLKKDFFIQRFDPVDKQNNFKRSRAITVNILAIIFIYGISFYFTFFNIWPYISVMALWYSFIIARINLELYEKYEKEISFFIFAYISALVFLASIYYTWKWTFNDNSIPENLANKEIINNIIQEKYPNYNYKLLYMNDKYIFTKVYCDSINEINAKVLMIPNEEFLKLDKLSK